MKPSEMSLSRLSAAIDHWILELHLEHSQLNDLIEEMENRLRNSIPKPVVEMERVSGAWFVKLGDLKIKVFYDDDWDNSEKVMLDWVKRLRTALGLEGGE